MYEKLKCNVCSGNIYIILLEGKIMMQYNCNGSMYYIILGYAKWQSTRTSCVCNYFSCFDTRQLIYLLLYCVVLKWIALVDLLCFVCTRVSLYIRLFVHTPGTASTVARGMSASNKQVHVTIARTTCKTQTLLTPIH